jgi:hypothetical protein
VDWWTYPRPDWRVGCDCVHAGQGRQGVECCTVMVSILNALLTPLIAIITTYIAYQQFKGNQLKLKMDRYERRLRVYQEVVTMLRTCSDGKPEWGVLIAFGASTAEADFLFGPEIRQYIDEIIKRAAALNAAKAEYRDFTQTAPAGYDHDIVVKEMMDQIKWFTEQITGLLAKNKFAKYLNIS